MMLRLAVFTLAVHLLLLEIDGRAVRRRIGSDEEKSIHLDSGTFHIRKESKLAEAKPREFFCFCNIGTGEIGLVNINTDAMILLALDRLPGWKSSYANQLSGIPLIQHIWSHDGRHIYVSIDSGKETNTPSAVLIVRIGGIRWTRNKASARIVKYLPFMDANGPIQVIITPGDVKSRPGFKPLPTSTFFASRIQAHGPALRPYSSFFYFTTWVNDKIIAMDYKKNVIPASNIFEFNKKSRFHHGIFFSPNGEKALGTKYNWNEESLILYKMTKGKAEPTPDGSITLKRCPSRKKKRRLIEQKQPPKFVVACESRGAARGAMTHYVDWLNNRYAFTVTMQLHRTSVEPSERIDPPGVYLIDTVKKTAQKVIGEYFLLFPLALSV